MTAKPNNDGKVEEWEERLRKELNLKYGLLGISKQPLGNREQWINDDIETIRSLLAAQRREWRENLRNKLFDRYMNEKEHSARMVWSTVGRWIDDILKEMEKP